MSGPLVVDASALVDALLPTTRRDAVLAAMQGKELWAPQILDLETMSAVARLERARQITTAEAARAIDDLAAMPIDRLNSDMLREPVWALRGAIRISDGFYLACAQALGGPLLTTDARLSRAPLSGITVTLVG